MMPQKMAAVTKNHVVNDENDCSEVKHIKALEQTTCN